MARGYAPPPRAEWRSCPCDPTPGRATPSDRRPDPDQSRDRQANPRTVARHRRTRCHRRLHGRAAARVRRGSSSAWSATAAFVHDAGSAWTTPHRRANHVKAAGGKGKALGVINVIAQGSLRAFALEATGLAPTRGFAYAVWLFNSRRSALFLGFIDQRVTSNGQAKAIATLPRAASRYRYIIITRETAARPSKPGRIVLRGRLRLGQPSPPDRARDDGAA